MRVSRSLRVLYIGEVFPSKSETWIHHEIAELRRIGCSVAMVVTHRKPTSLAVELQQFVEISTYLPEQNFPFWASIWRLCDKRLVGLAVKGLWGAPFSLRHKAQIIRDLYYAGKILPFVQNFHPDVMLVHFAGTRANVAMFVSVLTGIPYAFKLHAADVFSRPALLREKFMLSSAAMTISEYNIRYLRQQYPDVDLSSLVKHACGLPLEDYAFRPVAHMLDMPRIIGVGRLVRMKGFDVLLKASRILLDQGFLHQLVLVGDGPEYFSLLSLSKSLGLRESLIFQGYCGPGEVKALLQGASVFALPARWDSVSKTQDGIPVALMEAMAVGVPVVSTTTSGIPELIEHGVSGILVEPDEPTALAAAIKISCEMAPEKRLDMLCAARHKIESEHDSQALAEDLYKILIRLGCGEVAENRWQL